MASVYSVSQINGYIRHMFEQDFLLGQISVKGEVSNLKYHTSGHIYFSLKDQGGVLQAVMFAGSRRGLNFHMENGDRIVASGEISVYERDGRYQLYAKRIEKEGVGDLYTRYLALKQELEEMGMFDPMYKKPIPKFVKRIGIVTASTGAAIHDMSQIAKRRNPYVQLYLYPAKVQGEGAAQTIVEGIRYLDTMQLDAIIVGRGGGSIEDLWAFNERIVAEAIFACNTPVISAVGHESDTTISDWVADLRASTPSAAVELAVFDYKQFLDRIQELQEQMHHDMWTKLNWNKDRAQRYTALLKLHAPGKTVEQKKLYTAQLKQRLRDIMEQKHTSYRHRLTLSCQRLGDLSPLKKLCGGYGYLTIDGKPVTEVGQVEPKDKLRVQLAQGSLETEVLAVHAEQ